MRALIAAVIALLVVAFATHQTVFSLAGNIAECVATGFIKSPCFGEPSVSRSLEGAHRQGSRSPKGTVDGTGAVVDRTSAIPFIPTPNTDGSEAMTQLVLQREKDAANALQTYGPQPDSEAILAARRRTVNQHLIELNHRINHFLQTGD